jgi:hypothetical protein
MPSLPPELSAALDLPAFEDRLPDLVQVLRETSRGLNRAHSHQSYIPYWEDAYAVAHSLKGVLKILNCPDELAEIIVRITESLNAGIVGEWVCRDLKGAASSFQALAHLLDIDDANRADISALKTWLKNFPKLYTPDVAHEERLSEVPKHLVYVSEVVSKKAREVKLLGLNDCVIEDQVLLDDIALWRTQLNEAMVMEEYGRGLVVNFLPFISSEGSRALNVWAWVAAATPSRAALKQRVKDLLPKVQLSKL